MNTLLAYVLSFFIPGLGQATLGQLRQALFIASTWIVSLLLLSNFDWLAILWPALIHFSFVTWALINLYHFIRNHSGYRKALMQLIISTVIAMVLIPMGIFYFYKGGLQASRFVGDELLSENATKEEMKKIQSGLEKYMQFYGYYPEELSILTNKPTRRSWEFDEWKQPYQYIREDSLHYNLISLGRDGVLNTKDDLRLTEFDSK